MSEKLRPSEIDRAGRPKIFFLPSSVVAEEGPLAEIRVNLELFGFRVRSSSEFKIGSWGHDNDKRLTKDIARNMIQTVQPDIEVIEDALEGKKGPNVLAVTPKSHGSTPLPAVLAVFTKLPHEVREPLGMARLLGKPLRALHVAHKEIPAPLYYGTVMDQLDVIVVFSQDGKRQWQPYFPEKEITVIPMEDPVRGTMLFAQFAMDVLARHGRPRSEDWKRKKQRGLIGKIIKPRISRTV